MEFFSKSNLSSLSMFELVGNVGRRGDKIPKIGIQRIVDKGNKYIRAETGDRSAGGIIPVDDERR